MLLSRVFITLEGVLARLDPGLGFVELFGDAFRDALGRRFSPDRLRRDAFVALRGVDKLARQAPDDVRRVLERWGEGSIGQVTVALDAGEARRRSRESQSLRQTSVAGFLTIAGSVLMAGTEGRTQVIGGVMTAVGSALLVLRFFRG